jgi:hypothetical protein
MPQDFSHQNLRGRSFKGQDLTNANFSHSNIRGANFTNTILRNAKFLNAEAGLHYGWEVSFLIGSILLAALSGFTLTYIVSLVGIRLTSSDQPQGIFISVVSLITLATFCIFTIRKGLVAAIETMFWAMALIATVYAAAALVVAISVVGTAAGPSAVAQAWTVVGAVGRSVITVGSAALTLAIVMILFAAESLAVAQAWIVAEAKGKTVVAVGATAGVVPVFFLAWATLRIELIVGIVTWAVAAGLSAYVSWRFLAGDEKHGFVWKVAIALAAMGGTKFRRADLTDADFTEATLENTDFRGATLIGICWFQSKRLFSTRF